MNASSRKSSSVVDINDPAFSKPLEIEEPAPIASPQALTILSAGLTAKARANQDCYQYVYVYRCKNNHMWPVPITCHQRFCPNCAESISEMLVDKYSRVDVGEGSILYMEISQVGDLTPEFVKSFQESIGAGFKSIEAIASMPIGTLWNVVPSYRRLTARLLLWGDDARTNETYRKAWPDANVKVSLRPAHQFHVALQHMFDPTLPKDAKIRGQYEILFHGLRRVRTMGKLYNNSQTTEDKLTDPESETSTDESTDLIPQEKEMGSNSEKSGKIFCPCCHEPARFVTGRKNADKWHKDKHCFNWYTDYKAS